MPNPDAWTAQTQWSPEPRHVGDARRFVRECLARAGLEHLTDVTCLIVSELVTNAIRHARSPFRVMLTCDGGRLVVEVHDESSTPVAVRDGQPFDVGGRGLHLVDVLSQDWGVTEHPDGKSIWAALDASEAQGFTP